MKVLEKIKIHYLAGKNLSQKLQSGEKLTPIVVKKAFKDSGSTIELTTAEVMSLTHYIKGLLMNEPSSNMNFHESIGHSMRYVDINNVKNYIVFTKIIKAKSSAPDLAGGYLEFTQCSYLSGFTFGFVNKDIATF